MKADPSINNPQIPITYESNYLDLPFEGILRVYRKKNIAEKLKSYTHKHFLEVGCGPDPLFIEFSDFDQMTIVEPGKTFCERAMAMAKSNSSIQIINDLIENRLDELRLKTYDFIVLGGFLHEISNPENILKTVRQLCSKETIVYSFVPNSHSFHRLLAFEMGIIKSVSQKSGHDKLFERKSSYDIESFNNLLIRNDFRVLESGSYFIKPFTHDQMHNMVNSNIINAKVLDGLDKMIKYMPDLGAEIWNCAKI